jgi:hypothetical protein
MVILAVWGMVAATAAALAVTYARVPVTDLYHVSHTGLAGGAGRLLVYLNYPVAFIAIALIGLAAVRLWRSKFGARATGRVAIITTVTIGVLLSAYAGLPGVVDQGDLDAKFLNVVPAIGVAIALAMTIVSIRVSGLGTNASWSRGDRVRLALTALVVFLSLPWLFAYLGVYVGDIPGLGTLFLSRQIPEGETLAAVHLGDHHGMNGALFFLVGLWLSREIPRIGPHVARWAIASYVSLMMAYGAFNAAQDFWLEQIVKRGWVTAEIPNVTRPALSITWGLMLLMTVSLAAFLIWNARREPSSEHDLPARTSLDRNEFGTQDMQHEQMKGSRHAIH